MKYHSLLIQVYIMMKACAYMTTNGIFVTYQANINPQRSNSKKLKKQQEVNIIDITNK